MNAACFGVRSVVRSSIGMVAMGALTTVALGQGATRDLSSFSGAGFSFAVSIVIDTPAGINVVGLEETPPSGWTVTSISDAGSWDIENQKVKWIFLTEPFPTEVTYDTASPTDAVGSLCFAGEVSFDGPAQPIEGDECIPIGIPATSGIGLTILGLLMLAIGSWLATKRSRCDREVAHGA